jgi:hypothetical protein
VEEKNKEISCHLMAILKRELVLRSGKFRTRLRNVGNSRTYGREQRQMSNTGIGEIKPVLSNPKAIEVLGCHEGPNGSVALI